MYATVKEVNEDTVLLDAGPGVELLFAKNSIGAVLSDDEYNRIVHGIEHDLKADADVVPDDASSLTGTDAADEPAVDLGKKDADEATADAATTQAAKDEQPKKADGDSEAK